MNYSIEKYIVEGNIYFWRYKERNLNKINWNFSANNQGCDSLLQLLKLMEDSEFSSKKSIETSTPTNLQLAVPNDRNIEWTTASLIELNYIKSGANQWSINVKNNSVEIIFGENKMHELKAAISKIKVGVGDFAISDNEENQVLYFWYSLKKMNYLCHFHVYPL